MQQCVGSGPLLLQAPAHLVGSLMAGGGAHTETKALGRPNPLMLPDSRNITPQGYEKLGFRREGNATVYREWAPAASSAHLIGDFNSWGGTHMEKDSFGVWKVTLPDGGGPCLQHDAWQLWVLYLLVWLGSQTCIRELDRCCGTYHRITSWRTQEDIATASSRGATVGLCSTLRMCPPCDIQILRASLPSHTDRG